mgnify:CR=1 FL=1
MASTFKTLVAGCACAVSLMGALPAQASVVIAGTRVIYHATDAEVTIEDANTKLTAVGLELNDQAKTVQLKSRVRGTYVPPKKK